VFPPILAGNSEYMTTFSPKVNNAFSSAIAFMLMVIIWGCSDKTIDYDPPKPNAFYPMEVGNRFTYLLDSTALTQFGRDTVVRHYRVKDSVAEAFTDAKGRPAFRIQRAIQPADGSSAYKNSETFVVALQDDQWIEYIENNMRFMKLRAPVEPGFTWKAHSFIETTTLGSSVRYLDGWDYQYTDVGNSFTILGKTYPNTISVLQRDEVFPEGPFNPQFFKQYDYGMEVYAEGIGLVYRNFDHKVWQPPANGQPGYWEDGSYRVIMRLESTNR